MIFLGTVLSGCSSAGNKQDQTSGGSGNNIACQGNSVCVVNGGSSATASPVPAKSAAPVTVSDDSGVHWVNGQFSVSGGLVINATVEEGFGGCPGGSGYVFPSTLNPGLTTSVPPGAGSKRSGKTWDEAPAAFGAVPASTDMIYIYLTGPTDHAVVITGLQFHVHSRKPAISGPWLYIPGQCGGSPSYHFAGVDFDTPAPYYVSISPPASEKQSTDALHFPYTATATDPVQLQISVQTDHTDATWDMTLTWIDGGATESALINDGGKPFEITSTTGLIRKEWQPPSQ